MRKLALVLFAIVALTASHARIASADALTASQIVAKVLESDPWGLSGAEVTARATLKDDQGRVKNLAFTTRSRRYDGSLTKSIVRVTAPGDLAGVAFLQIQKRSGDDDRHLLLPELKRARKIVGGSRGSSFVGTDFTYADMDRRDIRNSNATLLGDEKLGSYETFHLELVPTGSDATYARIEMWVRKDSYVPLKVKMFAKSGVHLKTLTTQEVKRISGRWFITRSLMENHADRRSTDLVLDDVKPTDSISDDEFTVRTLEKS
jgi:hypothetical protein